MSGKDEAGLSEVEASKRLQEHGPNVLPVAASSSVWKRFLDQFTSPLIYVLLLALAIDLAIWFVEGHQGWPFESIAIAVILIFNAGLSVYQESKAEAALAQLKALAEAFVWVMRDGQLVHLPSQKLVPGDLVRIEAGDRIPADGNLFEANQVLLIDESVMSGESLPIEKSSDSELMSGTLVTRGKGYMKVSRTGAESNAGKLATMIGAIEAEHTPLERRLRHFGSQIARWILVLAAVIAVAGVIADGLSRLGSVLLFAVALAVAAIPEGLPAVLTLTLALGVERMARKKAVIRRLSSVEALGSVTVIATDKTGTLTENKMRVKDLDSPMDELALRAMTIANDAEAGVEAGDPMELALLDYAISRGVDIAALDRRCVVKSVHPFDSSHKFMRVTVDEDGKLISYLKGAPEELISRSRLSEGDRSNWIEKSEVYALKGFRVLGLAQRSGEGDDNLTFLGLALIWDPPRKEVPEAIAAALRAGIRVLMVTGDHPATALAVANEVGIPQGPVLTGVDLRNLSAAELSLAVNNSNVFARVTPEDKLRLVETLKRNHEIVAVTGDGVNDAPALKRSDVGVAMGERGSDVSREVSDLILLDDNFATVVAAIEEGRNIYLNIQKFIRFLFSTNLSETMIVVFGLAGSLLLGLHDEAGRLFLPLTASQLLWVNVVTDGPPALALGLDRDSNVLRQPPRDPKSPLLDRPCLKFILTTGIFKAAVGGALLILLPQFGYNLLTTRTLLFLYMTIGQLMFAYPARLIAGHSRTNIFLHLAVILGIGLQILTVIVPALRLLLGLEPVELFGFAWLAGAVLLSWGFAETYGQLSLRSRLSHDSLSPNSIGSSFKRLLMLIVGLIVLVIGIALLILPGPGLLLISLGLAILASASASIRRLVRKLLSFVPIKKPDERM